MLSEDNTFGSYDKAEQRARNAYELYENGDMAHALVELEEALEINPSNGTWHFDKGLALDAMGRFTEAIAEYEIALDSNPSDLEILNSLAVDYTRTNQYDLGIGTFEHIQELDPSFEPAYCNRIITYTEMGQHDLAEQMFYLAQQIEPNCALCYYNIGNSLFVRSQYEKAISCWQRTAELEPTHPQIHYRIAQAYWSSGDNVRTREYFLEELRCNPGDIEVILDFGLFLIETGDIEAAKEKFNRILELSPDHPAALFYLGEIVFNLSYYKQAVKLFNKALTADEMMPGPRYRLAQYALMFDRPQEAKAYLVSESDLDLEDAEALVAMGSMFLKIGDADYATHCMLRAIDIDCANADAYYYLGNISTMSRRFKEAVEFFAHALDVNPEHIWALRDSAFVYLAMGKVSDAAERIQKAVEINGDDPQLKTALRQVRVLQTLETVTDFIGRFIPCFKR